MKSYEKEEICKECLNDQEFVSGYKNTLPISQLDPDMLDAIFFAGGHGTM